MEEQIILFIAYTLIFSYRCSSYDFKKQSIWRIQRLAKETTLGFVAGCPTSIISPSRS